MGPSQAEAISGDDIHNFDSIQLEKVAENSPDTIYNLIINDEQKGEKA